MIPSLDNKGLEDRYYTVVCAFLVCLMALRALIYQSVVLDLLLDRW